MARQPGVSNLIKKTGNQVSAWLPWHLVPVQSSNRNTKSRSTRTRSPTRRQNYQNTVKKVANNNRQRMQKSKSARSTRANSPGRGAKDVHKRVLREYYRNPY